MRDLEIADDDALPDDDEDRRIDAVAAERVATFDPAKAIPMEKMLQKFGVPSESQEALRELETGKGKSFRSVEDLMDDLHGDD